MLEIELKAYCDNLDLIKDKLVNELGFSNGEELHEADLYFNHPAYNFKDTDEALRLRRQNEKVYVAYKGPALSKIAKTRYEQEVGVSDYEGMKDILLKVGFTPVYEVRKTRRYFTKEDITITLDQVENLGNFVEIEVLGEDREAGEKRIFDLAKILGLSRFEHKSYLGLLLASAEK